MHTLDSGINVAPGITIDSLKNLHIMILVLFYINLGIALVFDFFFFKIFQKLLNVALCFFQSLE